ncbi:MAG: hypothetical protein ACI9SB_001989 [Candidatus Azotimanducaceae bacterium]|jgi:hypothetical protein
MMGRREEAFAAPRPYRPQDFPSKVYRDLTSLGTG